MWLLARMPHEYIISGEHIAPYLVFSKNGIGGSDAGAIVGLNPYRSAMNVYLDKISDDIEQESTEAIRCGHDLEQYVAERFCEATGKKVHRSNYMYRSIEYPFMQADVDRLVVGEDAGLECKTCNAYKASAWDDQGIPESYVMQCYHYMAVTGRKTWYIACLIMGVGFVYRKLVWDEEIITGLIRAEEEFWNGHVVPHIIPKPDGSESCNTVLGLIYPNAIKDSVAVISGVDDELDRREQIIRQIDELEKEKERIEQEIKLAMADHERVKSDRYRISWSNVESTRLDTKRMKDERPELFLEFAKKCYSRRFSVKVA